MKIRLIGNVKRKISHLAFDSLFYDWSLGNAAPERLTFAPVDSWPGDPAKGRWLCDSVLSGQISLWNTPEATPDWVAHVHSFSWLRGLRALGGDEARRTARGLTAEWLDNYHGWNPFFWRPDIAGRRVANWISFHSFFIQSADEEFQNQILLSLARQAKHLSRALPGDLAGLPLLHGIKGLVYAGLGLRGREAWLSQGLDLLQKETERQILPDGGHITRSPAQLLRALKIYIDVRAVLKAAGYPVPEQVEHTIDRMAQAARFFRYADRGFSVFNGAQEENDVALTDAVLTRANARGRILSNLPNTGYERMAAGRSLVMIDTGAPPARPNDGQAHAAPLAFEFVYGKERVFVSCGSHPYDAHWRDALRATPAHNTMTIDCRNACELREDGHFGRRPRTVAVHRQESRDSILIDAAHDGYVPLNGISHRRRLYLGEQGHDFRGEETLTCTTGLNRPVDIALRFHLHPKIQVSLIREGAEALLRLSGGAGWRFFHTGGVLTLEDSLYLGKGSRPRKTKQLVIHGRMETDAAQIKWAVQREGGR